MHADTNAHAHVNPQGADTHARACIHTFTCASTSARAHTHTLGLLLNLVTENPLPPIIKGITPCDPL